jgi:hypothetical protein
MKVARPTSHLSRHTGDLYFFDESLRKQPTGLPELCVQIFASVLLKEKKSGEWRHVGAGASGWSGERLRNDWLTQRAGCCTHSVES